MSLDLFGVTLAGQITTFETPQAAATTYDLWLDANTSDQQSLPQSLRALKSLSYVQDIQVEIGAGFNSKVSLVLTPPWDESLALLNSPLIQWGIGHLNVTLGYSTGSGNI